MAKTTKSAKLPKRIGGVKLSKTLRKKGGKLIEKANTPKGREVIAAGLAIAASAAAARARTRAPHVGETETTDGKPVADAGKVVDALSAAAGAFMNGLLGRKG